MSFQPVSFGKVFELVSRLAAGGMAEIFLARTKSIQGFEKYLVIKRISAYSHARSRVRAHVPRRGARRRDARFIRTSSRSTNVGHVDKRVLHRDGVPARPQSHRDRARGAKLGYAKPPLEHVVSILTQCCAGLHYAHDKRDFRRSQPRRSCIATSRRKNVVVSLTAASRSSIRIAKAATREVETLRRNAQRQDRLYVARAVQGRAGRSPQRHSSPSVSSCSS